MEEFLNDLVGTGLDGGQAGSRGGSQHEGLAAGGGGGSGNFGGSGGSGNLAAALGSAFGSGPYTAPAALLPPGGLFLPMNNDATKVEHSLASGIGTNSDNVDDDDDLDQPLGSEDGSGGPGVGVGRRKRQREANLQAQRRCRERHRTHVVDLEKEVEELRAEAAATRNENKRLQAALQQSLIGLEECQKRWTSTDKERDSLSKQKEDVKARLDQTLEAVKRLSVTNSELTSKLYSFPPGLVSLQTPTDVEGTSGSGNGNGSGNGGDPCAPCGELKQRIVAAYNGTATFEKVPVPPKKDLMAELALKADKGELDAELRAIVPTLQEDASLIAAVWRDELATGATEVSASTQDEMKRVALRLTEQFHTFLVNGNACSQMAVFSLMGNPATGVDSKGNPPCAAMSAQGPGQHESVFKQAHSIAKELDLTDGQRESVLGLWRGHAQKLNKLFETRKRLTADALMLQGSSPVATLVDFFSIGAGIMGGVTIESIEKEAMEAGGQVTLTGFARHACKVEGVISELRQNIGAEQMQNFVLVSEIVDDLLTPLQTCHICSKWGSGCPDMLAISRAIAVQSMERQQQQLLAAAAPR
eukprot:CAMPEP_0197580240 /NCGR_PEP_ID=MMETSP1326-20131121/4077_1 /TAXON_ID=1155430 /ORGANISM="Genus nov. species nov., Strain RCC2288" /LENGTH=586 /DNA_ID=CAMNT_0043143937 /DNA_START=316 /DNA_END=2079 /DNA_ORIENTATION=-